MAHEEKKTGGGVKNTTGLKQALIIPLIKIPLKQKHHSFKAITHSITLYEYIT